MSFPSEILPIKVEMHCTTVADPAPGWRNISADVLWDRYITIGQGRPDALRDTPPASCAFTLKNPNGNYSRRNPASIYYNRFGVGTPLRVRVGTERDDFATAVVNGWGSATVGGAWTLDGTAADFDKASGSGTIVVPAATNVRLAYLAGALHADVDMQVDFSCGAASITGASAYPVGLVVRGLSTTDYIYASVEAKTDGTFNLAIVTDDFSLVGDSVVTVVPNCTYAQNQRYVVRVAAYGSLYMAKMWRYGLTEPLEWTVTAADFQPKRSGWIGIRASTATSNTNANFTVTYDDFLVYSNRFGGEIATLRNGRDTSGEFDYVEVEAAGYLRRKAQGDEPVWSALRRATPTVDALLAYWPMEEGDNATRFTATTAHTNAMGIQSTANPDYAANSAFACSAPLPTFNGSAFGAFLPGYDSTINDSTMLRFIAQIPSTGDTATAVLARIWGTGTARLWQLVYTTASSGTITLEVYNTSITAVMTSVVATGVNGQLLRWSLELDQNGANVDWDVNRYQVDATTYSAASGTLNSFTIGQAYYVDFNPLAASLSGTAIGHVSVQTVLTDINDLLPQFNAYTGETAGVRIDRLCTENGVRSLGIDAGGFAAPSAYVGVQRVMPLIPLLREAAKTDQGTLFDARGYDMPAIQYRPAWSIYNQDPMLTLDFSLGQVSPVWEPVDDDQQVFNSVTAASVKGGEFLEELETGPMSKAEPEDGGVGKRETRYEVNTWHDSQLRDIAGTQLALGTVDEYRFPVLRVNLGSSPVVAAGLMNKALDVGVDDRIIVTNADATGVYDTITQVARGYRERFRQTDYTIDFHCTPESPYEIVELDDSDSLGYLDGESTVLYEAVSSSATSLRVWSLTESWSTTVPYPIMVGGERMTVTAITANTAPALIAATAAVHANNASVTPTMPVGVAAGNLLLILAAIRNSGTGIPDTPAGYTVLGDNGNLRLFGKMHSGSEVAPTITFTGGAANATCSAQMAALTNVLPFVYDRNTNLNGSSQNIAVVPNLTPLGPPSCNLQVAWKQDDWTSVATLSPLTEIAEASSTLGDDQGIVWDVLFCDGATIGPSIGSSFTVTGGVAAISRSIGVTLVASQTMTVTRSVNGLVKAHPADAPVNVAEPARLGLIGF